MDNREIDALIGAHYFGMRWMRMEITVEAMRLTSLLLNTLENPINWCEHGAVRWSQSDAKALRFEDWDRHLPHYSTRIEDAWRIVEVLAKDNQVFIGSAWECRIIDPRLCVEFHAWHTTAPLAIVRAALKLKGIECE